MHSIWKLTSSAELNLDKYQLESSMGTFQFSELIRLCMTQMTNSWLQQEEDIHLWPLQQGKAVQLTSQMLTSRAVSHNLQFATKKSQLPYLQIFMLYSCCKKQVFFPNKWFGEGWARNEEQEGKWEKRAEAKSCTLNYEGIQGHFSNRSSGQPLMTSEISPGTSHTSSYKCCN